MNHLKQGKQLNTVMSDSAEINNTVEAFADPPISQFSHDSYCVSFSLTRRFKVVFHFTWEKKVSLIKLEEVAKISFFI